MISKPNIFTLKTAIGLATTNGKSRSYLSCKHVDLMVIINLAAIRWFGPMACLLFPQLRSWGKELYNMGITIVCKATITKTKNDDTYAFWFVIIIEVFHFCIMVRYTQPLLSTKNLNLTKCRLVDVIKGLKSIAFFTKYLIISSIMISSPLTQIKYTTN